MSYVTFQECCKTFRASVRLGWGKERKGEGMGGEKKRLTHLRTEYGYKTFFLIERVHDEREYFLVYFSLFLVY